jgi:hypothetical protein
MLQGEHRWRICCGQIVVSGDNFIPDEFENREREIRKFRIIKSAKLQVSANVENIDTCGLKGRTKGLGGGEGMRKDEKN